jgi:hypothetical protein
MTASVRQQVVAILANASGKPAESIHDSDRLFEELHLSQEDKKDLASGFQRVARETNPQAHVSQNECAELLTVKGAVDLVTKKAKHAA